VVPLRPDVGRVPVRRAAQWLPDFGISYHVGVDGISLLLVVLTTFLTPIALLVLVGVGRSASRVLFFMLALEAAMIGVFVSLDLFLFYVFWDAMLIPMYFLIGIWGYDRRIYARSSSSSTRWPAAC
jgi:NADH-quinone oxidoreductase subunit M